jgi:hypothetical protein
MEFINKTLVEVRRSYVSGVEREFVTGNEIIRIVDHRWSIEESMGEFSVTGIFSSLWHSLHSTTVGRVYTDHAFRA